MEMPSPAPGETQTYPPAQAAGQSGWKAPLQKWPWCFWLNISQHGVLMVKKGSSIVDTISECCTQFWAPQYNRDMGILQQGQQRAAKMRKALKHICDYEKPKELFSVEKLKEILSICINS